MRIEFYTDFGGIEMVNIFYENGLQVSELKSVYEAQQVEHLTEIPTPDEA